MKNQTKFKLAKWLERNKRKIADLCEDLCLIAGYLVFCIGMAQIYKPLFLIFFGLGLIILGGINKND